MAEQDMAKEDMYKVLEEGRVAYEDEDWPALKKLLHDDIVWHEMDPNAQPKDYKGKDDVEEHFKFCLNGPYGVPKGRTYHVLEGDHAIVSDQIRDEVHRCTDIYRLVPSGRTEPRCLIREMWTCVTHPIEQGCEFTVGSGAVCDPGEADHGGQDDVEDIGTSPSPTGS